MPKRTPTDETARVAGWFARWLRAHREETGLTQEQLAHLAGLSRNQVQNLENNRNNSTSGRMTANPGLDTILALESAFGLELGGLLVAVRRYMQAHGGSTTPS